LRALFLRKADVSSQKDMSELLLYPLRFEPIYQYRLWGGRRLATLLSAPLRRTLAWECLVTYEDILLVELFLGNRDATITIARLQRSSA
jgi:hypothetical protein